jgi:DNA-directed RNA polymerase II subunit RPB7
LSERKGKKKLNLFSLFPKKKKLLIPKVEGTCSGKYGFIICVTGIESVSQGAIRDGGTGSATFSLRYGCLVFRPSRGEVLDAVVASVSKVGFFADAGPMQVFVSNHLIPDEYEFSSGGGGGGGGAGASGGGGGAGAGGSGGGEPAFVAADEGSRVTPGAEVRLRVVGTRMDANEIFCVATMKDDYLGVINAAAG